MNTNEATPRICTYKYGTKTCSDPCYITKGGRCEAKCSSHLTIAAKKARKKSITRKKQVGKFKDEKLKANLTKKAFMARYREGRKKIIEAIQNANVRRIASHLDKIKSDQEYVLVDNVISATFDPTAIKLKGKVDHIKSVANIRCTHAYPTKTIDCHN